MSKSPNDEMSEFKMSKMSLGVYDPKDIRRWLNRYEECLRIYPEFMKSIQYRQKDEFISYWNDDRDHRMLCED